MFEDSLVESSGTLRRRNPWTATVSFALQGLIAGILVLLPLLYTEALPWRQLTAIVNSPVPPPAQAPPAPGRPRSEQPRPLLADGRLRAPSIVPLRVAMVRDEATSSTESGAPDWAGVPGGIGTGVPNSILNNIVQTVPAIPKVAGPAKVRVSSGVAQGLLIHQMKPAYPTIAAQARIQGTVVLQAMIAKDGTVQDLRVLSGHPLLVNAAVDAVRQWVYRPTLLNGEPVEVIAPITVTFTLN